MRIDINIRQKQILNFLTKKDFANVPEILDFLTQNNIADVSRPTINRDIEELLSVDFVEKVSAGPQTAYKITSKAKLLTLIDPKEYFALAPDNRKAFTEFNWQIFDLLPDIEIFTESDVKAFERLQSEYSEQKSKLSQTLIQKEIERVTIELSWKSSKIEGNTYSLLETENLIKRGQEASGKTQEETQMILNHKVAIDYIFKNSNDFKTLSLSQLENLHSLLVKDLGIESGVRKTLVGITGTVYKPLDNEHQIREALELSISFLNKIENPHLKSFLTMLLVSYIQAFEDGNKRTSRILGNAILLAHNSFPLSFRNVDEVKYKEGLLLFYEQNNLTLFKQIFMEQAEFAVKNYFRSSST